MMFDGDFDDAPSPEPWSTTGLIIIGISLLIGAVMVAQSMLTPKTAEPDQTDTRQTHTPQTEASKRPAACTVLVVYDGDTLLCDMDGNGKKSGEYEKVRLLGIDSPEMHYSKKNTTGHDEPFAQEASSALNTLATGQTLRLEYDRQGKDRYGRTLAFVYPNNNPDVSLNEQMLAQGMARSLFLGANTRHKHRFETVEAQARHEKKGLWH